MRSVLLKDKPGPGHVRRAELPDAPVPGNDEVQIRLIFAGMCHTDLAMINGEIGPERGYFPTFPIVLGHEFLGRVIARGDNVENVSVGDRVIGGCHLTCGSCKWCLSRRSMLCERKKVLGLDTDGIFAEVFNLPAAVVVPVTNGVTDRLAALAEPFAVSAHAVELAAPEVGERIAIIGPGSIGQLTVGALKGYDVAVFGTKSDALQLQRCLQLGAREVYDESSAIERMYGTFDVVIEAAGATVAVSEGVRLLGRGGRLICLGLPADDATFSSAELALSEKTIIGARAYDRGTWKNIPGMLAEAPDLEETVSHVLHFDRYLEALDLIRSRSASKILLHF
ncbi:alcohol dehydrogenase catalytic domain-containing protein [Rhizobium lusitanum]|uniref:Alcohol dehydrogenase catalytic domain-containing protein n=1 Tax=Rhizobium lusitanum TaxID=293958 RepID=A0A6L9UCJ4_9HYPH|nr:alcohol dehydrogenase catalytic domain-containing protein [Rhizobium lusitanum]NEI73675.1 alcohol dehydrogenase catalytic domain-containing protein [Rhizobium lusitanum]